MFELYPSEQRGQEEIEQSSPQLIEIMARTIPFVAGIVLLFACCLVEGFKLTSQRVKSSLGGGVQSLSASIAAIDNCGQFNFDSCFLLSAAEKGADYTYGAVAAPGWALPLGAVLVILTAAIPILLKPGEAALDQQRENEKITGSEFNKNKGKGLK